MTESAARQKLQDAAAATGNGVELDVAGRARLGVQVSGTFVGTVTFEVTIDGVNWAALTVTPAAGGAAVTTATAPGLFSGVVSGFSRFRARVSAYTSGAITVDALATDAAG
jgi:hypothetical protein